MNVRLVITDSYVTREIPVTISEDALELLRSFVDDDFACEIVDIKED